MHVIKNRILSLRSHACGTQTELPLNSGHEPDESRDAETEAGNYLPDARLPALSIQTTKRLGGHTGDLLAQQEPTKLTLTNTPRNETSTELMFGNGTLVLRHPDNDKKLTDRHAVSQEQWANKLHANVTGTHSIENVTSALPMDIKQQAKQSPKFTTRRAERKSNNDQHLVKTRIGIHNLQTYQI